MASKRTRVKVKKTMTRAEACAEFERKKARQRRRMWRWRLFGGGAALLTCYGLGALWWSLPDSPQGRSFAALEARAWHLTANMGFRVEQIALTGRKHVDVDQIKAALGVKQGTPILALPLAEMRARLQAIAEVKSATIQRVLPGKLEIVLTERTPAAWWQKQGVLRLIDVEGVVLTRERYPGKKHLPVVVGEDAPKHVGELLALLDTAPSLKTDVVAAVRVGSRRWNIELARDVVVMLPEENTAAAWKRFAALAARESLMSKAIRSVDMRMEDRVFVMPLEQQQPPITFIAAQEI